jgi:membrane fusion protein, multidrug efflux system
VQATEEMRNYLTVTAPFDGIITERFAHPGALAGTTSGSAAKPLFRLEQISRLRLVVAVPEGGVDGIVRKARVAFTTPAFPGQTFHGSVARIAHSLEGQTRTMPVELDVANPRGRLAPGMYAEVKWPVHENRNSVMVPASSIAVTTERSFVIRVAEGRAEWVTVRRGLSSGDMVEVFGSLSPGDVILQRASDEIREGSPVQVAEAKPR